MTFKSAAGPSFTANEFLDAIPTRNSAVSMRSQDTRRIVLCAPLRRRWFMQAPFNWILPVRKQRLIELDALGAQVWRWCNGRRTTERVIELFAEEYCLSFHEACVAVMQFLRMLTERKMIAMIGFRGDGEGAA